MNLALACALSLLVVWYCCKPSKRNLSISEWRAEMIRRGIGVK